MRKHRPRIPTLLEIIGDATLADFDLLVSPFTDRTLTAEDLGASWAATRPDLLPIFVRSGAGVVPRVTRRKVLSRNIRKNSALS